MNSGWTGLNAKWLGLGFQLAYILPLLEESSGGGDNNAICNNIW